jgi:hypothetical protein
MFNRLIAATQIVKIRFKALPTFAMSSIMAASWDINSNFFYHVCRPSGEILQQHPLSHTLG